MPKTPVFSYPRATVLLPLALAACLASSAPVLAQAPRPDRPYQGLFGGSGNPNNPNRLDFNVSLYGGYDDNVLGQGVGQGSPGGGSGLDPRFQKSGSYEGAQAGLDYLRRLGESSLDLSVGTSYRYYPSVGEMTGFNHWATLGFSAPIGRRFTIAMTEGVNYSPYFAFSPMAGLFGSVPGEMANVDIGQALVERPSISYSSSASIAYRLSKRGTFSADYSLQYTDFRREAKNYTYGGGGARYSYRVSRHAALRLGYHYREGRLPSFYVDESYPPLQAHDIDAGLDYSRALSLSRKTTFAFGTGSSVIRGQDQGYASDRKMRTRYTVNVNANLTRQIGQSWTARLDYRRGFHTVEGFPQPFFTDAVTFHTGGYAGPRVSLSLDGGYSTGDVGLGQGAGNSHETWNGTAKVTVALSSATALYVDYFYYHYRFGGEVLVPLGLSRELDRQGIRGGLSLRLPLLR